MNLSHQYLINVPKQNWEDLTRIKSLENTSYYDLINEGIRKVVKEKFQTISQEQKQRNSLSDIAGF
jgi:hypothetical protein|tara:strand:+ start:486 stop:683 length:198 start_codon:yes stop_codon:yes gene_type:complete